MFSDWRVRGAIALYVVLPALLAGGCATTKKASSLETASMGDWSSPQTRVVSGEPAASVAAYNAASEDLSEANWQILEEWAPRNTWERIRRLNRDVREARRKAAQAQAAKGPPTTQRVKLPDVRTETLSDGKIVMYYRVRHYGGVNVKAPTNAIGKDLTSAHAVTVSDVSLQPLVDLVVTRLNKKGTVVALKEANTLVITCDPAMKEPVLQLLARVDVRRPQVEITARIFEANHDMDFQAGVRLLIQHLGSNRQFGMAGLFSAEDFLGTVSNPIVGNARDPGATMRIVNLFNSSGWPVEATVQALGQTGLVKIVSEPRMTTAVGKTAFMHSGQEVPVTSARISNNNVVSEKTTYKPIGVQLYVTPQIIGPDDVKLHVIVVVTSITGFRELPGITMATAPVVNPIFDKRQAQAEVTVKNGEALVMCGLRTTRSLTRESKVPLLGDIPGLGWLFKTHRSQNHITDLYFFITPQIIRE